MTIQRCLSVTHGIPAGISRRGAPLPTVCAMALLLAASAGQAYCPSVAMPYDWPYLAHGTPVQAVVDTLSVLQAMREGGALLPTVCAMALLPAGPAGQAYAPTALRHLMTDPDSPVADLYQSCGTCTVLRGAESRATLALMEVSQETHTPER